MRVFCIVVLAASLIVCMCAVSAIAQTTFAGTLVSSPNPPSQINGSGVWINPGQTVITWSVSQLTPADPWHYSYCLSVPCAAVSQFIVEASPDFTINDLFNRKGSGTAAEVATFTPDTAQPNLPDTIHGIRFSGVDSLSPTFQFDSFRAPVWGNFYASSNPTCPVQVATVFNAGLTANHVNPTEPPSNGSVTNHLLVPDTTQPIPDASTLVLGSISILPFIGSRLRKRR